MHRVKYDDGYMHDRNLALLTWEPLNEEEWPLLWEMAVFTVTLYLPSNLTDFLSRAVSAGGGSGYSAKEVGGGSGYSAKEVDDKKRFVSNLEKILNEINKQNFGDLPLENLKHVWKKSIFIFQNPKKINFEEYVLPLHELFSNIATEFTPRRSKFWPAVDVVWF